MLKLKIITTQVLKQFGRALFGIHTAISANRCNNSKPTWVDANSQNSTEFNLVNSLTQQTAVDVGETKLAYQCKTDDAIVKFHQLVLGVSRLKQFVIKFFCISPKLAKILASFVVFVGVIAVPTSLVNAQTNNNEDDPSVGFSPYYYDTSELTKNITEPASGEETIDVNLLFYLVTHRVTIGETYPVMVSVHESSTATTDDYSLIENLSFTTGSGLFERNVAIPIIKINGDNLDEIQETIVLDLTFAESTRANFRARGGTEWVKTIRLTINIIDNDESPDLTIDDVAEEEGGEGGEPFEFLPTLSRVSTLDVTVTYSTKPGGFFPVDSADYSSVSDSIMIPAGQLTPIDSNGDPQPIKVTTIEDILSEPDETFILDYSADYANVTDTATGTLLNDDAPILTINSFSIDEEDGTANFEVNITPAPENPVDVTFTTSNDSAGALDFNVSTTSPLQFAAGEKTKQISIDIINDALDEDDETITVTLSNTAGLNMYQNGVGTLTIIDDDLPPTVSLTLATYSFNENDATKNMTVELSAASGRLVTAQFDLTEDTATEPEDYRLRTGATKVLTFNPGETSKVLPVAIRNDPHDDPDSETFTVSLSNLSNVNPGAYLSSTVNILDNDLPPVASIVVNATVMESSGANDASGVAVSLGVASGKTVKVGYTFADVSAEQGVDYTATNAILTFTPSTTTGLTPTSIFVPFSIIQDNVNEADETFTITLSEPNDANASVDDENKQVTVSITDDDSTLPIVGISDANGGEGNGTNNGTITFTISLTASDGTEVAAGRDIDVRVSTSSPTTGRAIATAGTDYQIITNRKVTIAKGSTSNTVDVTTIQDIAKESDEVFEITLSDPNYADISNTANKAIGTIISDDTPVFEIVDVSQAEGNTSVNNNMEFKVKLSTGARSQATVHYATTDGPPLAGEIARKGLDYTETTSLGGTPLNFAVGETEKSILVPIIGDDKGEHDDTFTLTLSNPSSGVEILPSGRVATGTILNDDEIPVSAISVAPATGKARVREGQAVEFTFTAIPNLLKPTDIKISLTDPQNFLAPGVVTTKKFTMSAGRTHTESFMTKSANTRFDPDNIVSITIESDAPKYIADSQNSTSVVIEDTLTPSGISVLALESSVTEGDPDNLTADFQVKSNVVNSSARVINIAISQGEANFLSSGTLATDEVTIGAGERSVLLPISIESDNLFEIHGAVRVEILAADSSSASYSVARTNNTARIAILDNDFPTADPNNSVSIRAIKSTVSETEVAPFQVVAKRAMTQARIVRVLVENKDSGDFLPATTYDNAIDVIIGVGALFANFDVLLDNDSKYESQGAITATVQAEDISGGGSRTYQVSRVNQAEIAVTSDDPDVPIISISSAAETSGVTEGLTFDFEVTSDRTITGSPMEIHFTPSYNGGSVDPNIRISGRTISIPAGKTKATGTVTMNSGFDIGATDDVKIKIEVNESAIYDTKTSESSITVPIKDNDAPSTTTPRMSISSVNYVADGEMATFTVTASHQPDSAIDVNVKLSASSFLDDTQRS